MSQTLAQFNASQAKADETSLQALAALLAGRTERRNFYAWSTLEYATESAIFLLMVHQFRQDRKKRQAQLIYDWFIKGEIPEALQDYGYLSRINISSRESQEASTRFNDAMSKVGKTISEKISKHGFVAGVALAIGGDTKLAADLFDPAARLVWSMLVSDSKYGSRSKHQPSAEYQPRASFATQVALLKKAMKEAGFDPDGLGIY